MPRANEQPQHRQVNSRRHQRRHERRHLKLQRQVEDVPKPKQESEPDDQPHRDRDKPSNRLRPGAHAGPPPEPGSSKLASTTNVPTKTPWSAPFPSSGSPAEGTNLRRTRAPESCKFIGHHCP